LVVVGVDKEVRVKLLPVIPLRFRRLHVRIHNREILQPLRLLPEVELDAF
jgi:hypothetical protein